MCALSCRHRRVPFEHSRQSAQSNINRMLQHSMVVARSLHRMVAVLAAAAVMAVRALSKFNLKSKWEITAAFCVPVFHFHFEQMSDWHLAAPINVCDCLLDVGAFSHD